MQQWRSSATVSLVREEPLTIGNGGDEFDDFLGGVVTGGSLQRNTYGGKSTAY